MSDRRAVSAGHLGASSVAAHEAWRVAVGGNRVESMTVEQIAHAFHGGQLNARTPLWPPGATGWQALGNFPEFQQHPSAYAQPALAQFAEADDDPTRMWTGGNDLGSMEAAMQAPHARPPAQTGVRQVVAPRPPAPSAPQAPAYSQPANYSQSNYSQSNYSQPANYAPPSAYAMPSPPPVPSRPAPMPSRPAPTASVASNQSHQPALVPSSMPPFRSKSRGNGLMLAAGLVGLVGLGSAVLAARGNWGSSAQRANEEVAVSAETPATAEPAAEAAQPEPKAGEAQLAKYEDTSALAGEAAKPAAKEGASEEEKPAAAAKLDEPVSDAPKADAAKAEQTSSAKASEDSDDARSAKTEKANNRAERARSEEASSKRASAREKKRAAALAAAERRKPAPRAAKMIEKPEKPEVVEKAEKLEKAEKAEKPAAAESQQAPANSTVNEAAAAALSNSANLAASCRPRGGPAGAGKARVIYSNDGEVQSVEILTAKFRDTLTGSCVRMVFRRAKIAPFKGEPPTFIKSFTIPEE